MTLTPANEFAPVALWRRLAAIIYDLLVLACVIFVAWQPVVLLPQDLWPDWFGDLLRRCYLFLLIYGFFGWFWVHGGQTIGMRAWKIRVVDQSSQPGNLVAISWRQALIRVLVAAFSLALAGLGFIWSLFNPEKHTWHDLASTSRLVKTTRQP